MEKDENALLNLDEDKEACPGRDRKAQADGRWRGRPDDAETTKLTK